MKYGEIIELGRHKLMCGDATSRDDVMRLIDGVKVDLVLTDPPYGIRILGNSSRGKLGNARTYPEVIGDNGTEMFKDYYRISRILCNNMIIWGGRISRTYYRRHAVGCSGISREQKDYHFQTEN